MTPEDQPEEVGERTERFEAFVREGEALEQEPQRPSNAFRLATLAGGLVVFAGVVSLLLR